MFQEGKVKNYQAERGFGFIQVDGESRDLFFHIKDMPNRNIQPQIGEKLKFRIVEEKGKFRADNIVRLDLKAEPLHQGAGSPARESNRAAPRDQAGSGKAKYITLIGLVIIAVLAAVTYGKYRDYQAQK